MRFARVAVIGVGLIGGSFALALKAARLAGHVVGIGRGAANLRLALDQGVIDSIGADAAGADLVLVAAPVAQYPALFAALAPLLKPGALVTDAGSTKRDVVAAARAALGARISQFVPAHPIAGAEKSGAAAATADLFKGKRVVLAPLRENPAASVAAVEAAWLACGEVVGIGRSAANLNLAKDRGIVDSIAREIGDADLVLVAS
ncbi:MAG TPA: prephenate dehydrogenase/arogenate dehydrogenase family protein, partial [Burkholderiales bacterium]|nr:prephenate dehydrogenase/arogenate dehydrogenase family protein [Burkholderiales bacterium]